jgi:hypothetical protein
MIHCMFFVYQIRVRNFEWLMRGLRMMTSSSCLSKMLHGLFTVFCNRIKLTCLIWIPVCLPKIVYIYFHRNEAGTVSTVIWPPKIKEFIKISFRTMTFKWLIHKKTQNALSLILKLFLLFMKVIKLT